MEDELGNLVFVVVGDNKTEKIETSDSESQDVDVPVPISVKIESIEEGSDLESEYIEVKPDIEVLDEELLSQEDYLEDITDDLRKTKTKKTLRKTPHDCLIDEEEQLIPVVPRKKARRRANVNKTKVPQKKSAPKKNLEEEYLEIEYLEDNIGSPKQIKEDTNCSDEEVQYLEIEYLDVSPKKENKITPKKKVSYEDDDEDYSPVKDEYEEKYNVKKTNKASTKARKVKGTKVKAPTVKSKKEIPFKSFIDELRKQQPIFEEDTNKLVEYLAVYMRRRRPPSPLPNFYQINEEGEYSCSYCDVESPTLTLAARHFQHAHGPRYLVCLACGADFRSTVNLYKHEKRCRAPDASIQLRARGFFLGRKGRSRPFLTKNKFIPREIEKPDSEQPVEKPKFQCPQCPAVYSRVYLLKEHMCKHIGFRPYKCPECPAAYISLYQLNRHSKKHSNDAFVCDHCGKIFKLKNTLVSHMDTHLPRPRFGCARCGRRYAKRVAVKVHILRDHLHQPPPAACPICPKRYNRMSHVKYHMKRDHGLTLLTRNAINRNLPYMKLKDFEGAKIVLNSDEGQKIVDLEPNEEGETNEMLLDLKENTEESEAPVVVQMQLPLLPTSME